MAFEKNWAAVASRAFTANGGVYGQITIADTRGYKVGMLAKIAAIGQPEIDVKIKRVLSRTMLQVGPKDSPYAKAEWTDVTAYTTGNSAYIYSKEQAKVVVPPIDRDMATFDHEPTVAWRNVLVDQYGTYLDTILDQNGVNRLAVDGNFTAEVDVQVNVDIDGQYDPINNPDPDDIGLIGHSRSATPSKANLLQRLTAIQGTLDTTNWSLDIAVHDGNGERIFSDFGASPRALRVAALLGNASGSADFGTAPITTQTLRTIANLQRNGNELSYNAGALDANTLRVAAVLSNASGIINFDAGATGGQTVRVVSNIQRNGNELSYNAGALDANTLRVAAILSNATGAIDFNYGTVGAQTIRTAAQLGNSTGQADWNNGATGAQTLRATVNLSDGNANKITSSNIPSTGNQLLHAQTPDTTTAATPLGALNANVQISLQGLSSVGFQLSAGGNLVGTINAQCSLDGGSSWITVPLIDTSTSAVYTGGFIITSPNTLKVLEIRSIGGSSHARVIVTSYTSGTGTALLRASQVTGSSSSITIAAFSTTTPTFPTVSNSPSIILASNPNRKYAYISNNSLFTLRIQFGSSTGLTTNTGLPIPPNSYYELKGDNLFTGNIYGIMSTSSTLSVLEGTP